MTEQISTDTAAATVEKFLYALRDKDLDTAASLLDEDLLYQNVGFSTIRGSRRTIKLLASLQRPSMGFDVKFHRVATEGNAVLTERTDALIFGRVRLNFWVCGTFEVRNGRITLWRDYVDALDFTKAFVRGLAATVRPALQRKF